MLPDEPDALVRLVDWSRDGNLIAFYQIIESTNNVFLVNKDGSHKIQLTQFTDKNDSGAPALEWAPDGKRIAFSHNGALYIVNADGTGLQKITEDLEISEICWVPVSG